MVEVGLSPDNSGCARVGFGGDTLNTAVYMARCLAGSDITCAYVTHLGDDEHARQMTRAWQAEGLDTQYVRRISGEVTGLYTISVDEQGERRFNYWRSNAPVREMLSGADGERLAGELKTFDGLYYSGITLAVLRPEGRERLLDAAQAVKANGGIVAFDTNHRPTLWQQGDVPAIVRRAIGTSTVALPSVEDLMNIFETNADDWPTFLEHLIDGGDVVLRYGPSDLRVLTDGQWQAFDLARAKRVVDTTAAGDSFNAGYLSARLLGRDVASAVEQAHRLARLVVSHPGAIIDRALMPC